MTAADVWSNPVTVTIIGFMVAALTAGATAWVKNRQEMPVTIRTVATTETETALTSLRELNIRLIEENHRLAAQIEELRTEIVVLRNRVGDLENREGKPSWP